MAGQLIADPQNPLAPDDAMIYVHGTFAPDAPWTLPESGLTRALKKELPNAAFYRFRWSGGNSYQARLEAGGALREAFRELRQQSSHTRLHVVTHSHGGNVLLYALAHQPALVASVVCLATPSCTSAIQACGSRVGPGTSSRCCP